MSVDVIIPAYKPDSCLAHIIECLNKQTVVPDNIRVVLTSDSDTETSRVRYMLSPYDNIILTTVSRKNFSHGGTRQKTAEESDADYLLFMTQDAIPYGSEMVEQLVKACSIPNAACAYARQLPNKNADPVERFSRLYNYSGKSHSRCAADIEKIGIKSIFFSDTCSIYKRSVFNKTGGFDTKTKFGEDTLYAYKALKSGYTVEYCAEASVYHSHNLSLVQQFKRNREIAVMHKHHADIFENMKTESEGLKYFRRGIRYFREQGYPQYCIRLFLSCVARYAGFFVGKHFD